MGPTYAVGYTTELYFKQNGEMRRRPKGGFQGAVPGGQTEDEGESVGHWQLSLRQSFNFENALAAKVYVDPRGRDLKAPSVSPS